MADSKFAQFIAARKLDPRRILAASHGMERLQLEDRIVKLNKRRAKKAAADGGGDNAAKETRKPRSGRPVTPRALDAAVRGAPLSGPTKTRILRAINHLLELKKENLEIVEVTVDDKSNCAGKTIRQVQLPPGSRVISVVRNGKASIPDETMQLVPGDSVLAILEPGKEDELRRVLVKE